MTVDTLPGIGKVTISDSASELPGLGPVVISDAPPHPTGSPRQHYLSVLAKVGPAKFWEMNRGSMSPDFVRGLYRQAGVSREHTESIINPPVDYKAAANEAALNASPFWRKHKTLGRASQAVQEIPAALQQGFDEILSSMAPLVGAEPIEVRPTTAQTPVNAVARMAGGLVGFAALGGNPIWQGLESTGAIVFGKAIGQGAMRRALDAVAAKLGPKAARAIGSSLSQMTPGSALMAAESIASQYQQNRIVDWGQVAKDAGLGGVTAIALTGALHGVGAVAGIRSASGREAMVAKTTAEPKPVEVVQTTVIDHAGKRPTITKVNASSQRPAITARNERLAAEARAQALFESPPQEAEGPAIARPAGPSRADTTARNQWLATNPEAGVPQGAALPSQREAAVRNVQSVITKALARREEIKYRKTLLGKNIHPGELKAINAEGRGLNREIARLQQQMVDIRSGKTIIAGPGEPPVEPPAAAPVPVKPPPPPKPIVVKQVVAVDHRGTAGNVETKVIGKPAPAASPPAPVIPAENVPVAPTAPVAEPVTPAVEAKPGWHITEAEYETVFPKAGKVVDGREVLPDIPNTSSLDSSLETYSEADGIRDVSFADFEVSGPPKFRSVTEKARTEKLAEEIRQSNQIKPLIVVWDKDGPYILEGGHRFDALRLLGAKSFPAKVVFDEDSLAGAVKKALKAGEPVPAEVLADYPDLAAKYAPAPIPPPVEPVAPPAAPAVVETPGMREPWRMTLDEYKQTLSNPKDRVAWGNHRQYVRNAIADGQTVPDRVLADYPDLAAKYAPARAETPPAMAEDAARAISMDAEAQGEAGQRLMQRHGDEVNVGQNGTYETLLAEQRKAMARAVASGMEPKQALDEALTRMKEAVKKQNANGREVQVHRAETFGQDKLYADFYKLRAARARVASRVTSALQDAKATLHGESGRMRILSPDDPDAKQLFDDLALIGRDYLKTAGRSFEEWSAAMVAHFTDLSRGAGENVKPYLAHVWKMLESERGVKAAEPTPRPVTAPITRAEQPLGRTQPVPGGEGATPKTAGPVEAQQAVSAGMQGETTSPVFAAKHQVTKDEDAMAGFVRAKTPYGSDAELIANVKERLNPNHADHINPLRVTSEVLSDKHGRILNGEEMLAVGLDKLRLDAKLKKSRAELADTIERGGDNPLLRDQIEYDAQQVADYVTALWESGSAAGGSFRARQLFQSEDTSLDAFLRNKTIKEGRKLTESETADIRQEHLKLEQREAEVQKLEAAFEAKKKASGYVEPAIPAGMQKTPRKATRPVLKTLGDVFHLDTSKNTYITTDRFKADVEYLRKKYATAGAVAPTPSREDVAAVARIVAGIVESKAVVPARELYRILTKEAGIPANVASAGIHEGLRDSRLRASKERLAGRTAEVQQHIAEVTPLVSDRLKPVVPDEELLVARAGYRAQLSRLDAMTKTPEELTRWQHFNEYLNMPRTLLTMGDLGHLHRQLGVFEVAENASWRSAAKSAVDMLMSEKHMGLSQERRWSRPSYAVAKAAKLWESPFENLADVGRKEEFFAGAGPIERWAKGKIPGLKQIGQMARAGERSYVEAGNVARFEIFDKYYNLYGDKLSLDAYKELANFLNKGSGRGSLGGFERSAGTLSGLLFAPRWRMSRIQMYGSLFAKSPEVRKIAAKNLAGYVFSRAAFYGALIAAGGIATSDPDSSDFGKVKFGNTRIDVMSGELPIVRGMTRLLLDFKHRSDNEKRTYDPMFAAQTFGRGLLAPAAGMAVSAVVGKDITGKEYSLRQTPRIALDTLLPLFVQDTVDAWKEGGYERALMTVPFTFAGVGMQTYSKMPPGFPTKGSDPLVKELERMKLSPKSAVASIKVLEKDVRLSGADKESFQTQVGRAMTQAARQLMSLESYRDSSDKDKKEWMIEELNLAKSEARDDFIYKKELAALEAGN